MAALKATVIMSALSVNFPPTPFRRKILCASSVTLRRFLLPTTGKSPPLFSTLSPLSSSSVASESAVALPSISKEIDPAYLSCSLPEKKPLKVAVLLSGGVDSSVALRLLHAAGHSCSAFYLKIWFQVCILSLPIT